MGTRILAATLLLVTVGAREAQGQTLGLLGPKDGHDLQPTDLERVRVGDPAPDFTLEALDGRRIALSDHRGKKVVVLVFYRGWW
ncbi:MAG: redoxin domain-containing protein [Gemmatimonadetes bacterium]|nr:redoxin domain-containing protein [Gemmatimonadota bacterium]